MCRPGLSPESCHTQQPPDRRSPQMSTAEIDKSFLGPHQELEIDKLYRTLIKLEGSDLHMKVGLPPHIRCERRSAAA